MACAYEHTRYHDHLITENDARRDEQLREIYYVDTQLGVGGMHEPSLDEVHTHYRHTISPPQEQHQHLPHRAHHSASLATLPVLSLAHLLMTFKIDPRSGEEVNGVLGVDVVTARQQPTTREVNAWMRQI